MKSHRIKATAYLVTSCLLTSSIPARGQWLSVTNETATRLANAPGNGYAYLTDPDEKDYAVGDLDNDGDADLIVVRKQPLTTQGKRSNHLFVNEDGVLTNRTEQLAPQLLNPTNNRDVAFVDVNADGWLDVVTAPTFPAMPYPTADPPSTWMPRVYMNLADDAEGNWLGLVYTYNDQRIPDFGNEQYPFFGSVSAGDVSGDGDPDLWFVDYASDGSVPEGPGGPLQNRLLFNNGYGFFTDVTAANVLNAGASAILGNGFGPHGALADLDGDGDLDIITVDANSANPHALYFGRNAGSGVFTATVNYGPSPVAAYQFDVGDLNNDGKLDFWEVDDATDKVFRNTGNNAQGNPVFTQSTPTNQASATTGGFGGNMYLADLNNDGFCDAVVCDENANLPQGGNRMAVFQNLGNLPNVTLTGMGDPFALDGTFGTRDTFDVAVIDIDMDGRLDLVVGQHTGTKVFIQAADSAPPALVSSSVPDGTVDVFQDRGPAGGALQGLTQVALTFSELLRDAATDGPVTATSFAVTVTTNLPGVEPPQIVAVTRAGATYTVTFATPISPGAWTTITPMVEDLSGNSIGPVSIDLGFLPGDVNRDGVVTSTDLLTLVDGANTCAAAGTCGTPAVVALHDVNRNGFVAASDVIRTVQLINGVNTQNAWGGVALPPQP